MIVDLLDVEDVQAMSSKYLDNRPLRPVCHVLMVHLIEVQTAQHRPPARDLKHEGARVIE